MLSSLIQILSYQTVLSLCLTCIFLGFSTNTSSTHAATTTYTVTSEEEVPVRSGQGTEYKILALLKDKDLITALEEDGFWIRVRTATDREGWVLKRYLTNLPSTDEIFTLPITNSTAESVSTSSPVTSNENQPQESPAASPLLFPPVQGEKETTEQIASNAPPPTLTEKELTLKELQEQLARLMEENKALRQNERIQWFLAGGGVFIFGWLIGLITCRSKRRKPSLL